MHLNLLFKRIVLYKVKILNAIQASRKKHEMFPVLMVFISYRAIKGLLHCYRTLPSVIE